MLYDCHKAERPATRSPGSQGMEHQMNRYLVLVPGLPAGIEQLAISRSAAANAAAAALGLAALPAGAVAIAISSAAAAAAIR